MNITATLPPLYGKFRDIQKVNYPFNHSFVNYVEAIAALGLKRQLPPDHLIGFIEDTLMRDMALPDIPVGDAPVKFRLRTNNKTICTYYEQTTLTNKYITFAIIRMTLRLTSFYGNSLSRLTYLISKLTAGESAPWTEATASISVPSGVEGQAWKERNTAVPPTTTPVEPEVEEDLVEPPVLKIGKLVTEPEAPVVKRLEALVAKGDELLTIKDTDEEDTVVETNPALSDFF